MLKTLWKDPVWAAVISAGIVGGLGAAGTYVLDLWPAIGQLVGSAMTHASAPNQYPNWVIWLLGLVALPTPFLVASLCWTAFRGQSAPDPTTSYRHDNFLGLKWRWRYLSDGTIDEVASFCPQCDFQVLPHSPGGYAMTEGTAFQCDSCASRLPTFDESYDSLESRVRRLIQQKLRSGSWRQQ